MRALYAQSVHLCWLGAILLLSLPFGYHSGETLRQTAMNILI